MLPKHNAKHDIVAISASLMHLKGFNNTGIQEILQRANIPKGSFYHYFKNKEDLGLQIIDYYTEMITSLFKRYLQDTTVLPLERLDNLMTFYAQHFKKMKYKLGCPLGNFSLEMGDLSEEFREKLYGSIDTLISIIESCLQEAKTEGQIADTIDTRKAAEFIFQSFEGALLYMKVSKSDRPLLVCKDAVKRYVQGK